MLLLFFSYFDIRSLIIRPGYPFIFRISYILFMELCMCMSEVRVNILEMVLNATIDHGSVDVQICSLVIGSSTLVCGSIV